MADKLFMNEERFKEIEPAIEWSVQQMTFARDRRFTAFQQYCGSHYSVGASRQIVPVNFLSLAVMIFVRRLAAKSPRAMISSDEPSLRPMASDLELAVNLIPGEIDLTKTIRQWVTEAMFAPWGVIKCGVSAGKTFADLVTLDDYFIDMSATNMRTIDFEGNDYWENHDKIMEDKRYVNKEGIVKDDRVTIGSNGQQKSQSMSVDGTLKTYQDKKQLRDVWLPDKGLMITYTIKEKRVIREVDLNELRNSPYYKLSYNEVPGQLMPLPSVSLWRDLHTLGNSLFRKLGNGADAQKSCLAFAGGDEESVNAFKNCRDGGGFKYNGQEPKRMTAGGIDPQTMMMFLQTRELMSYFAGNLDSLGGLGAMTETASQDRLIGDAANAQLDDMGDQTIIASQKVFEALTYYEYTDPKKKRILQKPIPGTDLTIPVEFGPSQRRKAKPDAFHLKVDVYSMKSDSPTVKLQKLRAYLSEFILPLEPFITAAGGTIDVKEILRQTGKYGNFEELEDLVVFVDSIAPRAGTPAASAPGNTTRTTRYQGVGNGGGGGTAEQLRSLIGAGAPQNAADQ